MSDAPCCSCNVVRRTQTKYLDGTYSFGWACESCGRIFAPMVHAFPAPAERIPFVPSGDIQYVTPTHDPRETPMGREIKAMMDEGEADMQGVHDRVAAETDAAWAMREYLIVPDGAPRSGRALAALQSAERLDDDDHGRSSDEDVRATLAAGPPRKPPR